MSILSTIQIDKAICFLKTHLRKNKFFLKINNDKIIKFSGSKRGNKIYAHLTEEKLKPIIKKLVSSHNCYFLTLTKSYDYQKPIESWSFFQKNLPKFIRKCKFQSYLYVYEAHEKGGCHAHLIVNDKISIDKIKKYWDGHIKIKKIKSDKIGSYLTKEIGKAGHVETALKNWDSGKFSNNDFKKIWRFYYLLKLKMRGWNCSRNLKIESKTKESETIHSENCESATRDSISIMNNSTSNKPKEKEIVIALPKKIIKNPIFRPYCEKVTEKSNDFKLITDYLLSLKIPKIQIKIINNKNI
jgi:hypothetical protein